MKKSLEKTVSEDTSSEKDLDQILFEQMLKIYNKTLDPRMHPIYFPRGIPRELKELESNYNNQDNTRYA